ncbi:MAG: CoA transferase [Alphaproteobacteria bacterium]|nr:MAG: CoA transferase [Alphaproteobacteria bacterium]
MTASPGDGSRAKGPLNGLRILEIAGIGPAPFACMWFADMGAEVVRIERPDGAGPFPIDPGRDLLRRGRRILPLDLKRPGAIRAVLKLLEKMDVLIEGFRPSVMERMGLGPDEVFARNPRLVYGRMTGWGQAGPWAESAGHDIDYIAISGALGAIGRRGAAPAVPLNLVGDFGGGAMYLIAGVLAALFERGRSGRGQVVDAAMVDGVAHLMTIVHSLDAMGLWRPERGGNLFDSGAPFYDAYETKDGRWLAVGCLEPQFYAEFLRLAGLADEPACARQYDPGTWPAMRKAIAARIAGKTREEWSAIFEGSDACVAPVLDYRESRDHPHMKARGIYRESRTGIVMPEAAPRHSRTPGRAGEPTPARVPGAEVRALLAEYGLEANEIAELIGSPDDDL